jgi:hypothetical protein
MKEDYNFSDNFDKHLFNELLKLNGDIHYTKYSDIEDASIYLDDKYHIQLGYSVVVVWAKIGDEFHELKAFYKSHYFMLKIINYVFKLM